MSVDFNQYVENYQQQIGNSQSFAGADHSFYLRAKAVALMRLARHRFSDCRRLSVLDVGCGIGLMEPHLAGAFYELVAVDVAEQAIEYARRTVQGVKFHTYDGETLPFPANRFDIVFATCVLHHVSPPQWREFVREMTRVVKPEGFAAVFEHNPYNPLTRLAVKRCEFDRDAVLLSGKRMRKLLQTAGLENVSLQYILFFPWQGKIWSATERMVGWLPLGAQYVTVGTKKRERVIAPEKTAFSRSCALSETGILRKTG